MANNTTRCGWRASLFTLKIKHKIWKVTKCTVAENLIICTLSFFGVKNSKLEVNRSLIKEIERSYLTITFRLSLSVACPSLARGRVFFPHFFVSRLNIGVATIQAHFRKAMSSLLGKTDFIFMFRPLWDLQLLFQLKLFVRYPWNASQKKLNTYLLFLKHKQFLERQSKWQKCYVQIGRKNGQGHTIYLKLRSYHGDLDIFLRRSDGKAQ